MGLVNTPDAPPFRGWSDAERTTTYRNYLLALKWQLMSSVVPNSQFWFLVRIDELLAQATLTQGDVQALISQVRSLIPAAPPTAPEKPERLDQGEIPEFPRRMGRAHELVDDIPKSPTAIADAFGRGAATDAIVRANLDRIKVHLRTWVTEQSTRVWVNRSPNAGYVAFNLDYQDNSKLMVAADFFAQSVDSTAGTLIHEATHGCLRTTDLAYMDSPYFLRLRDELALTNADNYKYAAELAAHLRQPMKIAEVPAQRTSIQTFEQALILCHYQCSKVTPALKYLHQHYEGDSRKLCEDTRVEHEAMMELGGDTTSWGWAGELTEIAKQRTMMLREIMEYVKSYVVTPKTFGEVGGMISATPVSPQWGVMQFDIAGANTVEDVAERIFVKLMTEAQFPGAQAKQLLRWFNALFANIRKDDEHKQKYNLSATDLQLYDLLRT